MDKSVSIGIIGAGVGVRMHLPGLQRQPGAHVTALCGSTFARTAEVAREHGIPRAVGDYRALCDLPDLDLIVVATPNRFHYEQACYALETGKHVLCEKPLAMTMAEVTELTARAGQRHTLALVNHQLRFNPYLRTIRALLASGRLGRPYFVRIHQQSIGFSHRAATWTWSFDDEAGGGVRLAVGSHLVDLIWFWIGPRPVCRVTGAMDAVVSPRRDERGELRAVRAAGFFSADLALAGNVNVQLSSTAAAVGEQEFECDVFATEGELHFDLMNRLRGAFLERRGEVVAIEVAGVSEEEASGRGSIFLTTFPYLAARIVEAIRTGDMNLMADAATFGDAIPTQQVLDAITESAHTGASVVLASGYVPGARV